MRTTQTDRVQNLLYQGLYNQCNNADATRQPTSAISIVARSAQKALFGSYLSVALEVLMVRSGVWQPQQSRCDRCSFHSGIDVPDRTIILTLRCVRRPVGPTDRLLNTLHGINTWDVFFFLQIHDRFYSSLSLFSKSLSSRHYSFFQGGCFYSQRTFLICLNLEGKVSDVHLPRGFILLLLVLYIWSKEDMRIKFRQLVIIIIIIIFCAEH